MNAVTLNRNRARRWTTALAACIFIVSTAMAVSRVRGSQLDNLLGGVSPGAVSERCCGSAAGPLVCVPG